ncbi:hypothetical protein JCM11641_008429, partial [Rhodosporidiobolus odoratus]
MSHNFSASLASLTGLGTRYPPRLQLLSSLTLPLGLDSTLRRRTDRRHPALAASRQSQHRSASANLPLGASTSLPHPLNFLNSRHSPQSCIEQSLLAPGPRSQSFIRQYTSFRFPAPAAPPPSNRWAASSPSTSAGPSHTSTPSSSNSNSRQAQQDKLQAAFGGPAAQGRIYQKASTGEPEGGGWGSGKSSAQGSRASSTSRASGPAPTSSLPESVPAISRSASPAPQDKGKGKGKQPQVAQEEGIELSEAALDELRGIEKALKGFLPPVKGKKVKRCFCS